MEAADRPISANSEKTASVEASEAINLRTAKHTFNGSVFAKSNLNVGKDLW